MTLPRRLVSLLVVYCFIVSGAAAPAAALRSPNRRLTATENSTRGILDQTYNFFSTLFSKQQNEPDDSSNADAGLKFHLSEAPGQPEAKTGNKVAPADVLSDAETQAILSRLPAIKTAAGDEVAFALRERSLPPPRPGTVVNKAFPPAEQSSAPDQKIGAALEVLRYSPQGDVPIAPNLSITFSQPMVAVTSQEEAAENVPVKLSPQPPGKWHWIGTKTLLFEPDVRFPMATQYSVTVPAGTKSANGGSLTQTLRWGFTTPAPVVKNFYPPRATVQRRDVLMFAEFDQQIDAAAILTNLKVVAGATQASIRPATKDEIDADENIRDLAKNAPKGRWLAFRAVDSRGQSNTALPAAANVDVTFLPGTPSAEGNRRTAEPQNFPFMTFAPLKLVRSYCFYNSTAPCSPEYSWQVEFNNPLDTETLSESQVHVEPPIDQLKVSAYGSTLRIDGVKKPNTNYRVIIDKSLRDKFGQMLEKDETVAFKVDDLPARIGLSGGSFVTLDPQGPRQLSLYSVNYHTVKISLFAVEPEDWLAFQHYRRTISSNQRTGTQITPPGRLVASNQIDLKPAPNEMIETPIDLAPALKDGFGQVIVTVESITPASDNYHNPLLAWVQSTQIGLDAFVDHDALVGWANSLTDGAPLSNAQLQIIPAKASGVTGADGLAQLQLKPSKDDVISVLVARRGNDVAILPENAENLWADRGSWSAKPQDDELRWYVFDDRKLYRPGEEVHVKGWIRRVGGNKGGDLGPLNGVIQRINYILEDSQRNDVLKGVLTTNAFGGFDFTFKLPPTMNLGSAQVKFNAETPVKGLDNQNWSHNLEVQEFRRPEFEVTAKMESEGPLFVGDHARVSVAANYFAGGGLPNAEVKWEVRSTPTTFTPPNRADYTFGKWVPWWESSPGGGDGNNEEELSGHTDAEGKHRLQIDFDSVKPARPTTVIAEASVEDVNRQTWTSSATMLVHPANLYVGLKSDQTFVQQGEPLVVQSIVTDLDGRSVADREIKMRAVLLDWKQIKGEWKEVETNPQDCLIKSEAEAARCTFNSKLGGTYQVTATIHDDRGRANETEITLWVAGGKQPPRNGVAEEEVKLIPDRKEYKAGDTAQILVQTPLYPAEAIMSLRRSGIIKTDRFRIDSPTYTLQVPIEEGWTPNVHVQVDIVGSESRNAGSADVPVRTEREARTSDPAKRPAYASGEINLSIPPLSRKLNVTATPHDKTLEPGGETLVDVEAKDAEGSAAKDSEIAVWVVDESVLALVNYQLSDPLALFYTNRDSETNDFHSRKDLVLSPVGQTDAEREKYLAEYGKGSQGVLADAADTVNVMAERPVTNLPLNGRALQSLALLTPGATKSGTNDSAIRLRENFNALAVFAPSVRTDANGRAQVRVKLPDNLTRYRVMAVAVAGGKQFGSGESTITARLPLMARPSAPRFLNFGDRFELPIVLQNQTDNALTVDVAVRAANATLSEPPAVPGGPVLPNPETTSTARPLSQAVLTAGRRVRVPANDRVEVRIPAAANQTGTARFQIGAVSGPWSDAADVELPVWTPATTESFATYGEIDEGAINQPVKAPANIFPQFGGLEIETSSTQLQELTDAVIYLTSYPYECSEQLASRVITIAALRDVLTAFKTKDLPSPPEMEAAVTRDLKRLQGMQNEDGGFGFWQRGNESWPFLSIHVAHALARAKQKKFAVPPEMFNKSQKYLRDIESHIPSFYSIDTRRAIIAYALYVRAQMGDSDPERARALIAEAGLEKLSLETVGWLLSVLTKDKDSVNEVGRIRHLLNNRVTETAGMAHFVCSYNDSDYLILNSDRRADGVILEALISDQPNSDLIPKIVRGLLAHRIRGRWENTQENVFILLALDRYFHAFEQVTPNFVARAWLGDRFAGEQQFKGRSNDRRQLNVPMNYLAAQTSAQNLVLDKDGAGRLYYRIGLNYAPADLNLKPVDYGFTVERAYEGVDDPQDVSRDADGVWHIKAGARVRVRLTMVATSRRYHVALVDPLPAGLEALNPVLATTGTMPRDDKQTGVAEFGSRSYGYGWWWWRPEWFEHQNLRDDRVEAFTSLLWEGVYKYSYVARATTPGQFVVPPAKAEEMYHPETFGRGKTDRVRVE